MKYKLLIAGVLALGLAVPAVGSVNDLGAKSPPLTEGQVWGGMVQFHVPEPIPNYAGILFFLTYDSHELSQLRMYPGFPHMGFETATGATGGTLVLPGSSTSPPAPNPIVLWASQASASGVNLQASQLVSLSVSYTAKNTTPLNNSDTDIVISPWLIRHMQDTLVVTLEESDYVYYPGALFTANGETTTITVGGPGYWSHIYATTIRTLPRSAFVATKAFASSVLHGIEHVPEPAAMSLIIVGAGSLLAARRRRRKGR